MRIYTTSFRREWLYRVITVVWDWTLYNVVNAWPNCYAWAVQNFHLKNLECSGLLYRFMVGSLGISSSLVVSYLRRKLWLHFAYPEGWRFILIWSVFFISALSRFRVSCCLLACRTDVESVNSFEWTRRAIYLWLRKLFSFVYTIL